MVRAFAHGAMGSILHGGHIELFLVPASAPQLVCLWDDAYKRTYAANQKE